MADILLATQVAQGAPSAGNAIFAFNSTTKRPQTVNDAGFRQMLDYVNFSTTSQAPAAASRTYIVGSNINFAAGSLQVGTAFRWTMNMTKTAAGSAASTFDICFGTAGSTADTARVSFTKPAGTAAIDEAVIQVTAVVRGPLGAANIVSGVFCLTHNLAATGHATIPCVAVQTVSAGFESSTVTNVGMCVTSGASDAITFQTVLTEAWNF